MTQRIQAVIYPAAAVFFPLPVIGKVVVVRTQIARPALSQRIQFEVSQVEMPVIDLVVSALHTDEQVIGTPAAPEHRDVHLTPETTVEVLRLRAFPGRRDIPDEMLRLGARPGNERMLTIGEKGISERPRGPEHAGRRLTAGVFAAVGEIQEEAGRPGGIDREESAFGESLRLGKAEIRSESRFQRGKTVRDIPGGIVPVSGALTPCTVGGVRGERYGQGCHGFRHNETGVIRVGFRDGERSDEQTAVAHHVPVEFAERPPCGAFLAGVGGDTRLHAEFDQPATDFLPRIRAQNGIQPIIPDSHRMRHLGCVEEVRGIPVRKRADSQEVFLRRAGVFLLAGEPPCHAEHIGSFEAFAADTQKTRPDKHMFQRFPCETRVRLPDYLADVFPEKRIAYGLLFETFHPVFFQEKPGMVRFERGKDRFRGRRGYSLPIGGAAKQESDERGSQDRRQRTHGGRPFRSE